MTKADFLELNLPQIEGNVGQYWVRADFSGVVNPLTRWLPNCVLKQDLLDL